MKGKGERLVKVGDEFLSFYEASVRYGIARETIRTRYLAGKRGEDLIKLISTRGKRLSGGQVAEIKDLLATMSPYAIAKKYKVSFQAIYAIKNGINHKDGGLMGAEQIIRELGRLYESEDDETELLPEFLKIRKAVTEFIEAMQ